MYVLSSWPSNAVLQSSLNDIRAAGSVSHQYGALCTAKCGVDYPVNYTRTKCYESYNFQNGVVNGAVQQTKCQTYGQHRPILKSWEDFLDFKKWHLTEDDREHILQSSILSRLALSS